MPSPDKGPTSQPDRTPKAVSSQNAPMRRGLSTGLFSREGRHAAARVSPMPPPEHSKHPLPKVNLSGTDSEGSVETGARRALAPNERINSDGKVETLIVDVFTDNPKAWQWAENELADFRAGRDLR